MSTEESFLKILGEFKRRRLYVNLQGDAMVTLRTGGIFSAAEADALLAKYLDKLGIVAVLHSSNQTVGLDLSSEIESCGDEYSIEMQAGLDGLGWEKVIVNFYNSSESNLHAFVPLAHNKICALQREPQWFYGSLLGFDEGKFVMEDAASWLTQEVS
jgi:hypothetical protein